MLAKFKCEELADKSEFHTRFIISELSYLWNAIPSAHNLKEMRLIWLMVQGIHSIVN